LTGNATRVPSWSEVSAELSRMGFRPSRKLGQNFLRDSNMARAIARDAALGPEDFALEVGPGGGVLSGALLELGVRLLAVEIDPRLAEWTRRLMAGSPGCEVLCADVLAGKHELNPEVASRLPRGKPWHLVANLPYSVSSPLLACLAHADDPPATMTVLVQREVAERILTEPGSSAWGPLGARLRLAYHASKGRPVGPHLFWPVPKVESQVLHLKRRERWPSKAEWSRFDAVVSLLFRHRRQSMGRALSRALGGREEALELCGRHGIDPTTRAECLTVEELVELSEDPALARAAAPPESS
jgi:16S rRNA (adenine1518-N6/adenine1519-N6)-dimethyltransferase